MHCKNLEFRINCMNTSIYSEKEGLLYNEATVVAINIAKNEVVAVGNVARQFIGRIDSSIRIIEPIQDGAIVDITSLVNMFKFIFRYRLNLSLATNAMANVIVPSDLTQMEFIMYEVLFKELGFKQIKIKYISHEKEVINESKCIVNVYKYKTEVIFFSNDNFIVSHKIINLGEKNITNKMKEVLQNKYGMECSEDEVKRISRITDGKMVNSESKTKKILVKGRSLETRLPITKEIDIGCFEEILNWKTNNVLKNLCEISSEIPQKIRNNIKQKNTNFIEEKFIAKNILMKKVKECM